MGRDISIAISAKDNFTNAITTMANANKNFNKDVDSLQQKLNALNQTKVSLKMDTDDLKRALKDAEKQYNKTGSAADRLQKEIAQTNYENAKRNLDMVGKSVRQTEKDMLSMSNTLNKLDNKSGSNRKPSFGFSQSGMLSTIATAGGAQLVGSMMSNVTGAYINSAFGDEAGTMASSVMAGAGSGAAIGTMIGGPGIGTAIGAAAGGLVGAVNGATEKFKKEDDAFRAKVRETYDKVMQESEQRTYEGSGIAGKREMDQLSFTTILKDEKKSKDYLDKLIDFANYTPFSYDDLTQMSKTLLTYGYNENKVIDTMRNVGDAGAALGMNPEDINMVATELGRMRSSDKTTLKFIQPIQDRGIDAIGALSDAYGKSKGDIYDMISKGEIKGSKASKIIEKFMEESFGGAMDKMSSTFEGKLSTLQDLEDGMKASRGEGYNEERKKGIQKEIDFFETSTGKETKEAEKYIGEYQASIENARRKAINDAKKRTVESDEYQFAKAKGDNEEMGKMLLKATIEGINSFGSTDEAKEAFGMEQELAMFAQASTAAHPQIWQNGYQLGQTLSKGINAGAQSFTIEVKTGIIKSPTTEEHVYEGIGSSDGSIPGRSRFLTGGTGGYATGLLRVPYDGFPAILHKNETVLTGSASLGRDRSSGWGGGVTVTGNNFIVREDADIDKIARALVGKMKQAALTAN